MILGMAVSGSTMLFGGAVLFVLTMFQVLSGLRVIDLGKAHRKIHRRTALTIVAVAALHGALGIIFVTGVSFL